ncbi:MAG TPA: S41 family peptidase [Candidatus Saccharimonadales bacterium]
MENKITLSPALLFVGATILVVIGFVLGTRNDTWQAMAAKIFGIEKSSEVINLDSVQDTYQYLKANYDGKLDTQKLIDGANQGLVAAAGDKHTMYLNASDANELQKDLDGDIGGGIGAEIGVRNDTPTIIRVLPGNPAEKAGLQKSDVLVSVNGEKTKDWTAEKAALAIRGEEGTTVKIVVLRDKKELTFDVKRAIVNNPSVQSRVANGIGILTITRFDGQTGALARKAAESFVTAKVKGIILDLRGDGGGYIDGAVGVASLWIKDGEVVVSQRKNGQTIDESKAEGKPLLAGMKTVVLIDEGSASASEIVAGALKDRAGATFVGQKSFGKGSVQQLISLPDNAQLKVTISRWYTPGGTNIDAKGFKPDVDVKLTKEDINSGKDPQLEAAEKIVK